MANNGISYRDDYCVHCGNGSEYIHKFNLEKFCEYNTGGHRMQSEVDELRSQVRLKEKGHLKNGNCTDKR